MPRRAMEINEGSGTDSASLDDDNSEPLVEHLAPDDAEPMDTTPVVAVAEAPGVEDIPAVPASDIVTGTYEWEVKNWSQLDDKEWSERFEVADRSWRIMLFPRGNAVKVDISQPQFASVYVECPDLDLEEPGWGLLAAFSITLVNQLDPLKDFRKETKHNFMAHSADWGFAEFFQLTELREGAGWMVDDTVVIRVQLSIDVKQSSCYDSRKETGFVGLRNQGATCYLNSWLQTLFNLNVFRQAVYHIPTTEESEPSKSIALALQTLFYQLQYSKRAVSTEDLTKSFGWDSTGSHMQEDVHEFNKILCETLELKMKGTKVCGLTDKIFSGHIVKSIECINVDFKSEKKDMFQDIMVDVKGCANVYDSFDRITAQDKLEGENQYDCEGHGKQDAKIGDLYEELPPVLQLHLKRFEYDFDRDTRVKINDRYEFPETLDLDNGDRKYLSQSSDPSKCNLYKLHSVLVHSGGTHGGHYFAFSRPDGCQWLRFDDEKVTRVDSTAAIEEQFGAQPSSGRGMVPGFNNSLGARVARTSSAYMLVYVREEEWDSIMCPVPDSDIAPHLHKRIQAEEERMAKERRERDEAHHYRLVRVATLQDMHAHVGDTVHYDLVDWTKVREWKVRKETLLSDFKLQLARDVGHEEAGVRRLWFYDTLPNKSRRPSTPVPPDHDSRRLADVGPLTSTPHTRRSTSLDLWLEDPSIPGASASLNEVKLVFLKHYNAREGRLFLRSARLLAPSTSIDLVARSLASKVGLPEDKIELLEEVRSDLHTQSNWEVLDRSKELAVMSLGHGDIIVSQELFTEAEAAAILRPTVLEYMDYVSLRRIVTLKPLPDTKSEGVKVDILGNANYESIAAAVAEKLGCDWQKLRLTLHSTYASRPRQDPVRWQDNRTLDGMLRSSTPPGEAPVLYYEVLKLPLLQVENLREFTVTFYDLQTKEVKTERLEVEKSLTVRDLLTSPGVQRDGDLQLPLKLLEVRDSEISKVFEDDTKLEDVTGRSDYWQLLAMPTGEDSEGDGDRDCSLLRVVHIPPDITANVKPFGVPFVMTVGPQETAAQVRDRIQRRLAVPPADFATWQLYVMHQLRKPEEIAETEIVVQRFSKRKSIDGDGYTRLAEQTCLGLAHANKGPKPRVKRPAPRDGSDRPMKIG